MTEGTDAEVIARLPPSLVPVTEAEASWLARERPRLGAVLALVVKGEQRYLAVRGDGRAEWALTALRLRRADGVPGTTRPPIDGTYAGAVLRSVLVALLTDEQWASQWEPTMTGSWAQLTAEQRGNWQALAMRVWEAQEFGHGPDHPVPPAELTRHAPHSRDKPEPGCLDCMAWIAEDRESRKWLTERYRPRREVSVDLLHRPVQYRGTTYLLRRVSGPDSWELAVELADPATGHVVHSAPLAHVLPADETSDRMVR